MLVCPIRGLTSQLKAAVRTSSGRGATLTLNVQVALVLCLSERQPYVGPFTYTQKLSIYP